MTIAKVYLHPRVRETELLAVVSQLRTRGWDVLDQPGAKYVRASPVREPRNVWWPKPYGP